MIHILSAFRNAASRLPGYYAQVDAARKVAHPYGEEVRPFLVWGDSTDQTGKILQQWLLPADLLTYHHGKPEHGSSEVPERLEALSGLLNATLEALTTRRHPEPEDTVMWLEGDLYWDPFLPLLLHRFLRRKEVDVVAPMVFAGEAFYDVWGFRTVDGRRWGPFWPYGLIEDFTRPDPLCEMGSVGSCVAMTGAVAQSVRVQDGLALVGWCREARQRSYRVWCAKELRVQHPVDLGR